MLILDDWTNGCAPTKQHAILFWGTTTRSYALDQACLPSSQPRTSVYMYRATARPRESHDRARKAQKAGGWGSDIRLTVRQHWRRNDYCLLRPKWWWDVFLFTYQYPSAYPGRSGPGQDGQSKDQRRREGLNCDVCTGGRAYNTNTVPVGCHGNRLGLGKVTALDQSAGLILAQVTRSVMQSSSKQGPGSVSILLSSCRAPKRNYLDFSRRYVLDYRRHAIPPSTLPCIMLPSIHALQTPMRSIPVRC